jgi:hypothetical protein
MSCACCERAIALLTVALALPLAAAAEEPAEEAPRAAAEHAERLELICTEAPVRRVSFGQPGEVNYTETAPQTTQPFPVTVTRTGPGADSRYDLATVESGLPALDSDEAIWIGSQQIEAQRGRFRINLDNLVMTLTEHGEGASGAARCGEGARSRGGHLWAGAARPSDGRRRGSRPGPTGRRCQTISPPARPAPQPAPPRSPAPCRRRCAS